LSWRAAAALVVHNAIIEEIPLETLNKLATIMEKHEELQDKVVVERAYACDAYYFVVHKAALTSMKANFSLQVGMPVDGKIQVGWTSEGDGGIAKHAGQAGGPRSFYPIYSLKCLNNKKLFSKDIPADQFRAPKSVEPQEDWVNFKLPWDDLDNQGDII
jgi:hypothetical protein